VKECPGGAPELFGVSRGLPGGPPMFDWDAVDAVVASEAKVVAAAATPVIEFPMALVFCLCFWPPVPIDAFEAF